MRMCFYRSPMAVDSRLPLIAEGMGFVIQSPLAIGSQQENLCDLCGSAVNLVSRRTNACRKVQ
jgi:hypothetical protein